MDSKSYYDILIGRIKECLSLSTSPQVLETTMNVISRYRCDLEENVNNSIRDEEAIRRYFKNFVNKSLSSVEAIGLAEQQYKAVRKLILSEIYGCCEVVVKDAKKVK